METKISGRRNGGRRRALVHINVENSRRRSAAATHTMSARAAGHLELPVAPDPVEANESTGSSTPQTIRAAGVAATSSSIIRAGDDMGCWMVEKRVAKRMLHMKLRQRLHSLQDARLKRVESTYEQRLEGRKGTDQGRNKSNVEIAAQMMRFRERRERGNGSND
jgi:hypothetical protein